MMPTMLRMPCKPTLAGLGLLMLLCSCEVIPPPIDEERVRRPIARENAFGQRVNTGLHPRLNHTGSIPLTRPPSVYAQSAIVVDINNKKVLYAKDADRKRAVASTQKIITALCVLEAGNLDKQVRIASTDGHCEPTKLGIRAGETYSRRELMKVLMVKSANDVARALARDVAGSQRAFANMMNRKCAELGMRNSRFQNPHGLTEGNQYSTARDLAIAAIEAYSKPTIREFAKTKDFTFRFDHGRTYNIGTTNKVLKTLPYCNGMKTGTTRASGRCLVATGSLHGRDVVVVILKSNSRHVWADATKLLRWALEPDLR